MRAGFGQSSGVRKAFGDLLVLDGIDLEVAAGEVLVVIGPSGSALFFLLTFPLTRLAARLERRRV